MFYIDDFNRDDSLTLENAVKLINSGKQDRSLLDNMLGMRLQLSLQQRIDEENFCDNWCYEINAYNKVFSEMRELFS